MTLQELKELAKNATPRRWQYCDGDIDFNITDEINGFIASQAVEDDAAFISAARNHIEELIERVEKLSQCIEDYIDVDTDENLSANQYAMERASRHRDMEDALTAFGSHVPLGEKK